MPVVNPIIFKVTDVGRDAAAYAFNNLPGGRLSLTAIKVGLAKYATVGNETALQSPLPNTFSIGGGGVQAGSGQIRFTPILASTTRIEAFEIGLFTDTGILFAIAATPSNTPLLVIEPDIEAIFSMNVALANVDPDSIEIVVDVNAPLAVVMMGQHLSAAHPHSQYKRTNDASERLKVADGVGNDEAVSVGQLGAEATTRAGVDSALAGQIAQEVLDRQEGDAAQKNGYFNIPILDLINNDATLVLPPNAIIRILLIAAGGGSGMVNENYSGVNDYSVYPNLGVAGDGQDSYLEISGIRIATAYGGKGGKSGMRDIGVDAGRYTGYSGVNGDSELNTGYGVLLNAAKSNNSTNREPSDIPYPFKAYLIDSLSLGGFGFGAFGSNGSFGAGVNDAGHGGAGGRGGVLEFLYKNTSTVNQTLYFKSGMGGVGYYHEIDIGTNYGGNNGQVGRVIVYA